MFCYATSQHYSANNIQACGSAISKKKEIETRPSLPVITRSNHKQNLNGQSETKLTK